MNLPSGDYRSEPSKLGSLPDASSTANGSFLSFNGDVKATHRLVLVQWLTSLVPLLNLPINVTDGELRACLSSGTVLCHILNKLRPGSVVVVSEPDNFLPSQSENVKSFLKALDVMGVPRFEISDLEKGSMKVVVDCLLILREKSLQNTLGDISSTNSNNTVSPQVNAPMNFHRSPTFGVEQRKIPADSKLQRVMSTPVMAEPSASLIHHVGHKFHEVFQLKSGSYADLPASKISEMMTSNSLDTAPTQFLLSVVYNILEESVENGNGEVPHRVACLLRKVTQEIERRMSTQAEHLRTQNNLFKAREEKYQSRIRVLEALTSGTKDECEIYPNPFQYMKVDKIKEKEKKVGDNVVRLIKQQEDKNLEISSLKIELETAKRTCEIQFFQLEEEAQRTVKELTKKTKEYKHQLKELRNETKKIKEKAKAAYEDEDKILEISALQQELETTKIAYEEECSQLRTETMDAEEKLIQKFQEYENRLEEFRNTAEKIREEEKKVDEKEIIRLMKEQEDKNLEISSLKQELETTKKTLELQWSQLEGEAKGSKAELEHKSQEYEHQLEKLRNKVKELEVSSDSKDAELKHKSQEYEHQLEKLRNKVKELEVSSDSRNQKWNMKMNELQTVVTFQFSSLQTLKLSWESIKQNVMKDQKVYAEECDRLGENLKPLLYAAENYHALLAENRKMFNEIQELKGNIRVFCRIKPFLSGKKEKQSVVEHTGENELVVVNPSKEGKDRSFKFNKVFGPATTQAEVYSDIQSFIRSVLDGYNVCIFAYGQTGSGKTYTMTGPNGATKETMGVNYRALNDLFRISTSRENFIHYEIGAQMVEIYNEQVRDLLTGDGFPPKKLEILTRSLPNGLAVPDASLFPVRSPEDVIKLMEIGLKHRAMGATAMNERSSRSHSVISIHVHGKDLRSGSTMVGNLHLVDLAGSERVDRSEVTGDRLKEAQHINKSLSALGDVIFALSQKSPHIPYRNSKLTQLLHASLGGQAKTLMFVQIHSDVSSYSETLSTLKFAERVSGIELGAARSSKDVRELTEQVSALRNTISAKEEEIERLHLQKGSVGGTHKRNHIPRSRSIKHLVEDDNQQAMYNHIHQNEFHHQSELYGGDIGKNIAATAEASGFTDSDIDRRSSDFSDIAPGTETDASSENSIRIDGAKSSERSKAIRKTVEVMRKLSRTTSISSTTTPTAKEPSKKSGIRKSISIGNIKQKLWK